MHNERKGYLEGIPVISLVGNRILLVIERMLKNSMEHSTISLVGSRMGDTEHLTISLVGS